MRQPRRGARGRPCKCVQCSMRAPAPPPRILLSLLMRRGPHQIGAGHQLPASRAQRPVGWTASSQGPNTSTAHHASWPNPTGKPPSTPPQPSGVRCCFPRGSSIPPNARDFFLHQKKEKNETRAQIHGGRQGTCLHANFFLKFHYKKRFSITSKCRHMVY
jgi:hypothetical protein